MSSHSRGASEVTECPPRVLLRCHWHTHTWQSSSRAAVAFLHAASYHRGNPAWAEGPPGSTAGGTHTHGLSHRHTHMSIHMHVHRQDRHLQIYPTHTRVYLQIHEDTHRDTYTHAPPTHTQTRQTWAGRVIYTHPTCSYKKRQTLYPSPHSLQSIWPAEWG